MALALARMEDMGMGIQNCCSQTADVVVEKLPKIGSPLTAIRYTHNVGVALNFFPEVNAIKQFRWACFLSVPATIKDMATSTYELGKSLVNTDKKSSDKVAQVAGKTACFLGAASDALDLAATGILAVANSGIFEVAATVLQVVDPLYIVSGALSLPMLVVKGKELDDFMDFEKENCVRDSTFLQIVQERDVSKYLGVNEKQYGAVQEIAENIASLGTTEEKTKFEFISKDRVSDVVRSKRVLYVATIVSLIGLACLVCPPLFGVVAPATLLFFSVLGYAYLAVASATKAIDLGLNLYSKYQFLKGMKQLEAIDFNERVAPKAA